MNRNVSVFTIHASVTHTAHWRHRHDINNANSSTTTCPLRGARFHRFTPPV